MTGNSDRQRLRIQFRKEDPARFLSHLDLMATLEYALRRARLPVELSEGFNPRPRLSLAAPLAVGYTGEREILEFGLRERLDPDLVRARLQGVLPAGIVLSEVTDVDPKAGKGAAARVESAVYRVTLPAPVTDLEPRTRMLLARDQIEVNEERDDARRTRDIRPFIRGIAAMDQQTLELDLAMGDAGSVRPETLLDLLGIPRYGARIRRLRIHLRDVDEETAG